MGHAGLRRFEEAVPLLKEASGLAHVSRDNYAKQLAYAVEVRTLAAQGKHESALALPVPDLRSALPAIRGEVLGSRALALASVGRTTEASSVIAQIAATSAAVELAVLCPAADATMAVRTADTDLVDRVKELERWAFHTGAVDLLVAAYRATPELLAVLIKASCDSDRFVELVRRAGDDDLARVVGQPIDVADDPAARLTRREREIYELVCQGLRYGQIAQLLFITEATVKAHMQHIFDKCGVRSREALAVHAALRRSDQATAARTSARDGSS